MLDPFGQYFVDFGPYWTNLETFLPFCLFEPVYLGLFYLDLSILSRLMGPVSLDPSIWPHLFGPVCLSWPRLFGSVDCDLYFLTHLFGLVCLDPSI